MSDHEGSSSEKTPTGGGTEPEDQKESKSISASGEETPAAAPKIEPADLDASYNRLLLILAPASSETASSGLGSTTLSDVGMEDLEAAKGIINSAMESDFKTIHQSGQLLSLRKAVSSLVKANVYSDKVGETLQKFHSQISDLRRAFERHSQDLEVANSKLNEMATLHAELSVHFPTLSKIQAEVEQSQKRKDDLSREIMNRQDRIIALEAEISVLKGEAASYQKELDGLATSHAALQKKKLDQHALIAGPGARLEELTSQKGGLLATKSQAEDHLMDIDSFWDDFKAQVSGKL